MTRVACYGAGYFSQFHIDGWQRIKGVELVGIANRDRAKAAATGLPAFGSVTEMLDKTKPDILDIIVSPAGHAAAIRQGLAQGVKAIICQKPFCTSVKEAREMAALARAAGIPLVIHENFRFQPWYRAIKTAIGAGGIGTPLQATFRLRPGDGQGPDAYLARQAYFQTMERFLVHETAVHWIDTFRFLFGNPNAVYADLRQVNPVIAGEDAGYILFDHSNGLRALFDGNRSLDHKAENTRCTMGEGLFEGTQGVLSLHGDGSVKLRKFGSQVDRIIHDADTSGTFGGDCAFHLQEHVVQALDGLRDFENTASDYLIVIEIEDAIYESANTGAKVDLTTTC